MNILVLSWRDPKHPLAGGAEQVMHEHMKGWIKGGHAVTFFSSRVKGLAKEEDLDGVKIIRRGYQYLGVQVAAFIYYLKNKNNFDLVVDEFHGVPFFTPAYVSCKILAVIQEPARDVWLKNELIFPINFLIGYLGLIFEPLFFKFYKKTLFMTGSESAKNNVEKYGIPRANIEVVPHGVLLPNSGIRQSPINKRKAISFLGTLSKDKGIEDAIYAFKLIDPQVSHQFWVIGKAENKKYFDYLKKMTNKLKFKNKVIFWGRVDEEKKFELLSKSILLLNPSVHEGWGLVNIEANACGVPVVAYPSEGLVDSVKNGISGIIVKDKKHELLAEEAIRLTTNPQLLTKLSNSSREWALNFDWNRSKKQSLLQLQSLFNGRSQ